MGKYYFEVKYASGEKQRFEGENIVELLNKQREFAVFAKEIKKNKNRKKRNQTNLEIVEISGVNCF